LSRTTEGEILTRLNEDKALEAAMEMAIEYGFDGFLDDVYALINEAKKL